jgi:plasmid stabilization system protein ParE
MNLIVTPKAKREMAEIAKWYEMRRHGLGGAFRQDLRVAFQQIVRFPLAAISVDGPIRRMLLQKYPYALFFAVDGNQIIVLSCMHQNRDPANWPTMDH